jgi:hypothetical protein
MKIEHIAMLIVLIIFLFLLSIIFNGKAQANKPLLSDKGQYCPLSIPHQMDCNPWWIEE